MSKKFCDYELNDGLHVAKDAFDLVSDFIRTQLYLDKSPSVNIREFKYLLQKKRNGRFWT